MTVLLDGKALAARCNAELKARVQRFAAEHFTPRLCVLRVGADPASEIYVRNKSAMCEQVGMRSEVRHLPEASEAEVLATVARWNEDPDVHAILVQLPLPQGIDERKVLDAIAPDKDVDGFHALHAGHLCQGRDGIVPCTPRGILALIDTCRQDLSGLHAVVLGRSNIVGKPAALLLLQRHATVTICHSRTADLPAVARTADLLVAAIGKPRIVRGDWIQHGAIVVDVGINRLPDGRLCGDVDFEAAKERAGAITPVPGGVGPMTIAMLLDNTLQCALRQVRER
jgi:methylenetetrahydrofolate dehydrogenase (NADP+)/methenyltetrahydrofolate cyclohydrolase